MMSGECRATFRGREAVRHFYVNHPRVQTTSTSSNRLTGENFKLASRLDVASGSRPSRWPLLGAARRLPRAHFATRSDAPVSALTPDRCLRSARALARARVRSPPPLPHPSSSRLRARGIRRGESTRAAHAPPSPRRRHERHQRHLGSSAGASRARSPANAPPGTPRSSPAPRSLRGAAIVVARARPRGTPPPILPAAP
jgi:hypothetical protein